MRAYKFTKRCYADAMLQEHMFRLGTLYDFRRTEHYGAHIGDGQEGAFSVNSERVTFNSDYDPEFLVSAQEFSVFWARGHLTDKPDTSVLSLTIHDLLVFCASLAFDERAFADFDCDTCIHISDFNAFSQALVSSVTLPVEKALTRPCDYVAKSSLTPRTPIPSLAFWKPPAYAQQAEIRLAISVLTDPVAPCLVYAPKAAQYCEIFRSRVEPLSSPGGQ
jgi:hypothetical protein